MSSQINLLHIQTNVSHLLHVPRIIKENLNFRPDLWVRVPGNLSPETLKQLHMHLTQALEPLKETSHDRRWRLTAIASGCDGGPSRQIWDDLIAKIENVKRLALQAQPLFLEYDPFLPEQYFSAQTEQVLKEIIQHVDRSGRIKSLNLLMHREWKELLKQTKVKGQRPEVREYFIALLMQLQLQTACNDLAGRWQRQMAVLGAPSATALGPEPEQVCQQYIYQLQQCLNWFTAVWSPLEHELKHAGLQWDTVLAEMPINLAEHGNLLRLCDAVQEKLPSILAAEINRRMYEANEAMFAALLHLLDLSNSTTEIVQRLRHATQNYDARAYREAFERLTDLYARQSELHLRYMLLTKLEQCAPGWATAIRNREGRHAKPELPGNPQEAWHWHQLQNILDRRTSTSLEELQERCLQLSNAIHRITAELVEKKAWAAQVRRTTTEQRRALQGWKEIMRKVGKGTGKRSALLLAEARRLMPTCQTAVPVWIMPLNRVVQNFDPRRNHFDVVIINEASQADIKALAAVYMGEQIVVVGDDEQVNEEEAQTIASCLIAASEQPEYQDATFGVISMLKDKQALRIDQLLRQYLPVTEYANRQVLCGTAAHFQGDERDVIFLSMVDTPKSNGPLSLHTEDAFEYMYKKRFNVAASRARDQLWVVHSLDPAIDLKDGDIRKRLILYANNPGDALLKLAEQEKKVESEFEKQVLRRLVQAGYHVVPQWPVGAYRIDLVVEGDGKRLAVECDGDRWHPIEKLEEDMARQAILERLGWRFVRIRGSHFFRNPDQALEPVFARLRALEMPPKRIDASTSILPLDEQELRNRITRRAAELRMQWDATASSALEHE